MVEPATDPAFALRDTSLGTRLKSSSRSYIPFGIPSEV